MSYRGKAKDKLTDALFSILEEKRYSEISISEICSRAGVERSTFYRSLRDKEELVELRLSRIMDEYFDTFIEKGKYSFKDYTTSLFEEYRQNISILLIVFRDNLDHCFFRFLVAFI